MSMGLCLGLLTAYFTWRSPATAGASAAAEKDSGEVDKIAAMLERDSITTAAVLGTLYWVTGLSAILYPGTKWMDPEFGEGAPQITLFLGHAVLAWVGWWFEMRRLRARL
jgi:hypothetical protein